jgi:hypothetical protein
MPTYENDLRSSTGGAQEDELTRAVREGVRPEEVKERLALAADKVAANVPMGIDASNKTLRKSIGGAAELLHLLKYGLMGLFLFLIGLAFMYVALLTGRFNLATFGLGTVLLVLGMWGLRSAYGAARNLRSISRA